MSAMFEQSRAQELVWQAREVVREVDHRPHLLVRITIRGGHFPQRALVPFMHIIEGEKVVARAWFTEITNDSRGLVGYFATDLPVAGVIEYGYFPQVLGRVPINFDAKAVRRLDRERLRQDVIETTSDYLRKKRHEG